MMVVKEPQESSEIVKSYPSLQWKTIGMPPLRIALITCVLITAIGGILSNPLFQWANSTVAGTPILNQSIAIESLNSLG